jgi:hypothetical protein
MSQENPNVVQGTEELLLSLCNSVTRVLNVATNSQVQYSGMVQRIRRPTSSPTSAALCCLTAASPVWSSSTCPLVGHGAVPQLPAEHGPVQRPGHQLHLGRSQQRDGRADEPGGG